MRAAYDEIVATAVKRQHEPQRVVGDLLTGRALREAGPLDQVPDRHSQAAARQGHRGVVFDGTPINETLVRDLAGGDFLAQQRNLVLVGGTGTCKTTSPWASPGPASAAAPAAAATMSSTW